MTRTTSPWPDILGCECWTADERFYRAAAPVSQRVRWIGEFAAPE